MPGQELRIDIAFPMVRAVFAGERVEAPFSLRFEQNFLLTVLDELDEYRPAFRERLLLPVGQQLFEALFPPPILALYLRARAKVRHAHHPRLTVRIVSANKQLLTLPWEFMYDARQGVFPATALETPVVRTFGTVHDGLALTPEPPLRVLLAGACPTEEPALDYDREFAAIEQVTRGSQAEVHVIRDATARAIEKAVGGFRPHILHVVAHGFADASASGLCLDDGSGYTHRVSSERIEGWFDRWTPHLVVLNACESGKLGVETPRGTLPLALLARGIPAVVAMQYRVPDAAGVLFAARFYDKLFSGLRVEEAVQSGRHALLASEGLLQRHFATPVLYLSRARGGSVCEVSHPAADRVPDPSHRTRSPFKYLDAFTRGEKEMFFGRSSAIEAIATLIATHRLSVVYGASGVGKTSLLHAGLAQSIAESLYHVITLRLVSDPIRGLLKAVETLMGQAGSAPAPDGRGRGGLTPLSGGRTAPAGDPSVDADDTIVASLTRRLLLAQSMEGRTLLLVVDQFEEAVTVLDEASRERFFGIVEKLFVNPELRLRIVLVVRDDFLGELDRFKGWFPAILSNRFRLAPLSGTEACEALEGPLNLVGVPFEQELIERIIQDLGAPRVDPASLQIAGHILFEEAMARGDSGLTLRRYEALDGVQGLMELHLGRVEKGLSSGEKNLLYRILQVFIGEYGTRRPVDQALLVKEIDKPWIQLRPWLTHLEEARVVRTVESDGNKEDGAGTGNPVWELSHDILIKAINRRADFLGFRTEVARLTRRMWALTAVAVVLAAIVVFGIGSYYGGHYSLWLRVVAPHDGQWHYHIVSGQEACRMFSGGAPRYETEGHFSGREKVLWVMPVGNYEVTLEEIGAEASGDDVLRFPVALEGFDRESVVFPPSPVLTFHGLTMVYVPGGKATLGNTSMAIKTVRGSTEKTVSMEPFYISRYEVTQGQYHEFLEASGTPPLLEHEDVKCLDAIYGDPAPRPDPEDFQYTVGVAEALWPQLPVVNVKPDEARAFAAWLTRLSNGRYRFRLPTPDEWELAARGFDGREFPWGDCFSYEGAWTNWMPNVSEDPFQELAPVGSFPDTCSPYGICDMAGNVTEFTSACVTSDGRIAAAAGRTDCQNLVVRGGNFTQLYYDAFLARITVVSLDTCASSIGFRLAMDVIGTD